MNKTTPLETSKLLKEAGFRQDTYFHWKIWIPNEYSGNMDRKLSHAPLIYDEKDRENVFAAPTIDELLEDISNENLLKYWCNITGSNMEDLINIIRNPNRVADCWFWLKKEGLLGGVENEFKALIY